MCCRGERERERETGEIERERGERRGGGAHRGKKGGNI